MSDDHGVTLDEFDVTIDLGALLEELWQLLGRYVVFPSVASHIAVTLWIAATHAQPAWEHAARLVLKSPEKRCGKSRALDIIEAAAYRALVTSNISTAALVHSIDAADPPTFLLDEADATFGTKKSAEAHEDLRGILNAGHGRGRPYLRWNMTARRLEKCPTFAMAAFASIGDLPATIEDRAIVVLMRRRAPGEEVDPFRARRDAPALHALRDRLSVCIRAYLDELERAVPDMPIEDRAADTWEPLIAIADLAGGEWPANARTACLEIVTASESATLDGSLGEKLLHGVSQAFELDGVEFLSSHDLLERLQGIEDAPWSDFGLTTNSLARKLAPFGIRPRQNSTRTKRGYRLGDCLDAFGRYLTSTGTDADDVDDQRGADSCRTLPF